jgi:hypothetical protein
VTSPARSSRRQNRHIPLIQRQRLSDVLRQAVNAQTIAQQDGVSGTGCNCRVCRWRYGELGCAVDCRYLEYLYRFASVTRVQPTRINEPAALKFVPVPVTVFPATETLPVV